MLEVAVLIPTKGRADKLPGLVENVHATTVMPHTVYLIVETTDAASRTAAWQLDATTIVGQYGSCAVAVNAGYHASSEPLVAVANDDCLFHDGWDVNAFAHLDEDHHIVGLNDGSGDCKCFQLFRRSYIERHSGVYDQPNTVYHPGYRSQCVDTEFAHYAMLRGVWQNAHDAVVEHEHWRFGKADPDHENYVKARATNAEDLDLYNRRRAEWDPGNVTPPCVPGAVMA